jgi:serine/threonine protein kinase
MSGSSAEKSLVGQLLLGRYRVLRRLALGGMGAVYLARTEGARGFSKPVVVKRILPIWGGDEEIVSLFAREARILSQLQDPGIVSVMDFGQLADGTLVMVLDYVHGYHLQHWQAYLRITQGQMPVEMALHIMLRVLSALQYAHTFLKPDGKLLAVVHRDVSPTNILLDTSGNVKLVDFGIARAEGDSNEYKTEAPQLRGKFGYLAPELFTGAPPTPQSDVYAAGVVLYELLIGDNPFRGREVTDSYHKALTVDAPSVSSLRDDATENLSAVIAKALAKDPAERYASAADFADALRPERAAPDELCQGRLRAAVQAAFSGALADTLGIEPLSASDEAWREAADGGHDLSLAHATHEPAPSLTPGGSVLRFARSPLPAAGGGSSPPFGSGSQGEGQLPLDDGEQQPTLHRMPSSVPPGLKPVHLRLVALLSLLLFGSLLAAGIFRSLEHKEDRVIVIEREASPMPEGQMAVASAPDEAAVAESDATRSTTPAEAKPAGGSAAQAPAKPAAAAQSAPLEPEPAVLTSRFAREQPRVQRCFGAHAQGASSLGELTIEFHVASSGTVDKTVLVPVQLASTALGTCLLEVAKSTRFPRLTHPVTFRIPIQARVAQP